MNIENETGFPHFQFEKVGYYGELFTVVVVNQTFDFSYSGGLCLIADEQRLPLMTDSWFGEPESSSLKTATDLVCRKVRADVLLNGHAWHATGETTDGRPVYRWVIFSANLIYVALANGNIYLTAGNLANLN